MDYPFGRNYDEDSNTAKHADHDSMKERLATTRRSNTRMRLPMQSVWEDTKDGLKEETTEIVGDIVVVWIRR